MASTYDLIISGDARLEQERARVVSVQAEVEAARARSLEAAINAGTVAADLREISEENRRRRFVLHDIRVFWTQEEIDRYRVVYDALKTGSESVLTPRANLAIIGGLVVNGEKQRVYNFLPGASGMSDKAKLISSVVDVGAGVGVTAVTYSIFYDAVMTNPALAQNTLINNDATGMLVMLGTFAVGSAAAFAASTSILNPAIDPFNKVADTLEARAREVSQKMGYLSPTSQASLLET